MTDLAAYRDASPVLRLPGVRARYRDEGILCDATGVLAVAGDELRVNDVLLGHLADVSTAFACPAEPNEPGRGARVFVLCGRAMLLTLPSDLDALALLEQLQLLPSQRPHALPATFATEITPRWSKAPHRWVLFVAPLAMLVALIASCARNPDWSLGSPGTVIILALAFFWLVFAPTVYRSATRGTLRITRDALAFETDRGAQRRVRLADVRQIVATPDAITLVPTEGAAFVFQPELPLLGQLDPLQANQGVVALIESARLREGNDAQ